MLFRLQIKAIKKFKVVSKYEIDSSMSEISIFDKL